MPAPEPLPVRNPEAVERLRRNIEGAIRERPSLSMDTARGVLGHIAALEAAIREANDLLSRGQPDRSPQSREALRVLSHALAGRA